MPDPPSTPKVVGVTEGMGEIGQGSVIALAQRDFDVVICDLTIDPAIAERMTTNAAPGARLSFIRNDLADPGDLPRFVDPIFAAFGHVECFVNNAALSTKSRGDLFVGSAESYDLNFAVNARGAFPSPMPSARRCSRPRATFPKARVRSCSYPPRMLSSQPRSAGDYAMSKATVARRLSCLPFA
jgi:3-oxoacyl-[acyl-carrier protein] reductase